MAIKHKARKQKTRKSISKRRIKVSQLHSVVKKSYQY